MEIIDDIITETKRLGIYKPFLHSCFKNIGECEKLKAEDLAELTEHIPAFRADFCQYIGIDQVLLTESVQKGLISSDVFLKSTLLMLRGMK